MAVIIKIKSFFIKTIRKFFLKYGVLLSNKSYDQLSSQRNNAIFKLVNKEKEGLISGVSIVVFSKDRAMQLNAMLESYFNFVKNPVNLFIIFQASSKVHYHAYTEIKSIFKNSLVDIQFIHENEGFRSTLISVLNKIKTQSMIFLTDDDMFINNIDLTCFSEIDPLKSVVTLRHSPHIRYSYTAGSKHSTPFLKPMQVDRVDAFEFQWFESKNEWSDPWSVDGHMLSTAEVRVLTSISNFKAPNSYEGALKSFNDIINNRTGICFPRSIIVNIPINRVQEEVLNKSGSISTDFLLEQWQKGFAIDIKRFSKIIPTSTHEEHTIFFIKRIKRV